MNDTESSQSLGDTGRNQGRFQRDSGKCTLYVANKSLMYTAQTRDVQFTAVELWKKIREVMKMQ